MRMITFNVIFHIIEMYYTSLQIIPVHTFSTILAPAIGFKVCKHTQYTILSSE